MCKLSFINIMYIISSKSGHCDTTGYMLLAILINMSMHIVAYVCAVCTVKWWVLVTGLHYIYVWYAILQCCEYNVTEIHYNTHFATGNLQWCLWSFKPPSLLTLYMFSWMRYFEFWLLLLQAVTAHWWWIHFINIVYILRFSIYVLLCIIMCNKYCAML